MRLNQQTDLAFRVLIHVALCPDRRVTIDEVTAAYRVSRNHLMKVVHLLARHGFLQTTRGAGGGMQLARPTESISLAEVTEAMEPDFALVECFRSDNQCVITPACSLAGILDQARLAFIEVLAGHSLADLVAHDQAPALSKLLKRRVASPDNS